MQATDLPIVMKIVQRCRYVRISDQTLTFSSRHETLPAVAPDITVLNDTLEVGVQPRYWRLPKTLRCVKEWLTMDERMPFATEVVNAAEGYCFTTYEKYITLPQQNVQVKLPMSDDTRRDVDMFLEGLVEHGDGLSLQRALETIQPWLTAGGTCVSLEATMMELGGELPIAAVQAFLNNTKYRSRMDIWPGTRGDSPLPESSNRCCQWYIRKEDREIGEWIWKQDMNHPARYLWLIHHATLEPQQDGWICLGDEPHTSMRATIFFRFCDLL